MRGLLFLLSVMPAVLVAAPGSTILPGKQYAWSPNVGWTNGNWNPAAPTGGQGISVGPTIVVGTMWSENIGWLNPGNGSPANGIRYSQTTGDFGVNHDGVGSLYGYAWSGNAGWVYFGSHPRARPSDRWDQAPSLDLATGNLHGYAWSGNIGWLQLGTSAGNSRLTTAMTWCGEDMDSDNIPDAWERERLTAAGRGIDLTTLGGNKDSDGDGQSDLQEYLADTDPFDPLVRLRVLSWAYFFPAGSISWTASNTRRFSMETSTDLTLWNSDPGPFPLTNGVMSTSGNITDPNLFLRIKASPFFCPN